MRFFSLASLTVAFALLVGCGQTIPAKQGETGAAGPAGPPGLIYMGTYSATTAYVATDVVTFNGSTYVSIAASTSVPPTGNPASAIRWSVLAQAGAIGPAGPAGQQGIQGPQGVQGITGATGSQGVQGPVGVAGTTPSAVLLSPWYGKTMVTFGDSIFAAFGIPPLIASNSGMTLKFNDSVGGRTLAAMLSHYPNGVSDGTNTARGNTLSQDLVGVALIMIELTTNDTATPLGSYSDLADCSATATVAGALRCNLETIKQANPTALVIMLTPYRTMYKWSQAAFRQLRDLLKNVCDDYSAPLIDQTYNGISQPQGNSAGNLGVYLQDGLHPTDAGVKTVIVPYLVQQIKPYGHVLAP